MIPIWLAFVTMIAWVAAFSWLFYKIGFQRGVKHERIEAEIWECNSREVDFDQDEEG